MLIRKLFKAEMAHCVPGAYTTRCHFLHGHSYKFELFFRSDAPNTVHMVADFKGIKDIGVNDFLDSFDHSVMVWDKDPLVPMIEKVNPRRYLVVPFIPTAEMMAKAFFVVTREIVKTGPKLSGEKDVDVDHVLVHETDTGYASFGLADLPKDEFPDIKFSEWIISDGIKADWKEKSWFQRVLKSFSTVAALLLLSLFSFGQLDAANSSSEVLYNGIEIKKPWPPHKENLKFEPMEVPYLLHPPKIIPIDVGRQLFVDDFLILKTNLTRAFHKPTEYSANPVIEPDQAWEQTHRIPTAYAFSDGVWFDPNDQLFKMWYMCGYTVATCYATSKDGLQWEKPLLDVVPGTNIVKPGPRNSSTTWLDLNQKDPAKRFVMAQVKDPDDVRLLLSYSGDGIHWGPVVAKSGVMEDPRSTFFYNPFRKVWVYSIRSHMQERRARRYSENSDLTRAGNWKKNPTWWVGPDQLDPVRPEYKTPPQLYNLDVFAYESIMVGLFSIWQGVNDTRPKINEVFVGFSRDGFHWDRSNRSPFIPVSEKENDWNWGNVQSVGGGALVVGDQLYFYHSGITGGGGRYEGTCATGLARMRRDGFASMTTTSKQSAGMLETRTVVFKGQHLFVNVDSKAGDLSAEILDAEGNVIPSFSAAKSIKVSLDSTLARVAWVGSSDLSAISNKPVRIRFLLKNSQLYSFWITDDANGASHGYVGAGGPGFTESTDTVGAGSTQKQ